MSYERRREIYVTQQLKDRLHLVLKIYPMAVVIEKGVRKRITTVEDLVDQMLTKAIETDYPAVFDVEKDIAARLKQAAKANGVEESDEPPF